MARSPQVERWFASTKPRSEAALRRVRDIILRADPSMRERIQYGITFSSTKSGDFAAFVRYSEPGVNLRLMRGGRLRGRYPHLDGVAVKRMRIADERDASARAPELRSMVKEWCALGGAAQASAIGEARVAVRNAKPLAHRSAPGTVDEYLAGLVPGFRVLLRGLRRTIRAAAPSASESITYGIPTFKQDGQRLIYFSAAMKHCAIHMVHKPHLDEAVQLGFGVGRGSVRLTPEHPLPERLLKRIVQARLAEIRPTTTRDAKGRPR